MCSPLARPSVQLASPWKIHVFHLATQPSRPPSPLFNVFLLVVLTPLTLTPFESTDSFYAM